MRVLLVEDDKTVARALALTLGSEGLNVYTTDLGEEGVDLGRRYDYDVILLDMSLPDMSGYDALRRLRASKVNTPILILSDSSNVESKVKGFRLGADDCMTKPVHKVELCARIHALVRRSKGHAGPLIEVGALVLNLQLKSVHVGGKWASLTPREYQLLELLSFQIGIPVTKEIILDKLNTPMGELKSVDALVCKLRKKLADVSEGCEYIETVRGIGYALREPSGALAHAS